MDESLHYSFKMTISPCRKAMGVAAGCSLKAKWANRVM